MSYRRYADERDYISSSDEEGEFIDSQTNDARLRKAISYLTHGGDGDATETYLDRIEMIDEHILQRFPAEGKSYNSKLYQQLQNLVREIQSDFQQPDEEESSLGLESDSSVEELMSPEALYRNASPVEAEAPRKVSEVFDDKYLSATSNVAHVREVRFKYGGPRNDVEEWYEELPPMLPFGENPYMEKWESMKINYDLRESAKRTADDAEPITTNVPYEAVEHSGGFVQQDIYDSGSRYKLPAGLPTHPVLNQKIWIAILQAFNSGGPLQKEKGYVPRLALHHTDLRPPVTQPSSSGNYAESSTAFEEQVGPSTTQKTSRAGTMGPKLHARLQQHQQRTQSVEGVNVAGPHQGVKPSQTARINPETQPRLKKLDATRKAAGARDAAHAARPTVPKVSKSLTPAASPKPAPPIPAPNIQRLAYVETNSSKRKPGRPRKLAVDPPYVTVSEDPSPVTPLQEIFDEDDLVPAASRKRKTRRKGDADPAYRLSPTSPSNRKRDEYLDYRESSAKRLKITPQGRADSPAKKKSGLKKAPTKLKSGFSK